MGWGRGFVSRCTGIVIEEYEEKDPLNTLINELS